MPKLSLNIITLVVFCLFLFLLPIQVWNNVVFPSQAGKVLFAGWAALVLFILFFGYILFFKTSYFNITVTDIGLIIFVTYLVAHSFFIRPISFHPFTIIEFFILTLVYLLVRIQEEKSIYWIFTTLVAIAFVQSVWGILQYYSILPSQHSQFNITGTFFNPAPFSGHLVALLPVVLGRLLYYFNYNFKKQKRIFRIVLIPVLGILVFVLILANSGAAWLAGAVSIVYLLVLWGRPGNLYIDKNKVYFWNKFQGSKYRKLIVFVFVALLLIVLTLKLYNIRTESANGRLLVWKSTVQMIADNPVTGVGAGQFKANYMHYQTKYLLNNNNPEEILLADNTIFAFNEFVRLTSELGIPGLLMVVFLLFTIFRTRQTNNLSLVVAKSSIVSILVFSLFSYPGSIVPIKVLFVFFMAIVANMQKHFVVTMPDNIRKGARLFVSTISLIMLMLSFQNIKEITVACRNWKKATKTIKSNKLETRIQLYKKAYLVLKTDGFFMGMYGNLLMREENYYKAESILTAASNLLPTSTVYLSLGDCYLQQQQFSKAEKAYKYALQMIPSRIKPVYKLAKLYAQTGREEEALCEIDNYLGQAKIKRTLASYEIELELIELKNEIESFLKP